MPAKKLPDTFIDWRRDFPDAGRYRRTQRSDLPRVTSLGLFAILLTLAAVFGMANAPNPAAAQHHRRTG